MKKHILKRLLLAYLFLSLNLAYSQFDPGFRNDYTSPPVVVSPSPTIARLMDFTNFPTANYTGIPSINIPLFNCNTTNKDFKFNLSLNYHPNGIKVQNTAGIVGTGWSLFNGGAISRTMNGIPDETQFYGVLNNDYYNYYSMNDVDDRKQFLYNVVNGCFDKGPDIFNFNFFNHKGKFLIYKDNNNIQQIYVDSESDLKVNVAYDTENRISSFTITDDRGYKYFFQNKEFTTVNTWTHIFTESSHQWIQPVPPAPIFYSSAWNLTKVEDYNQEILLEYRYEHVIEVMEKNSNLENLVQDRSRYYDNINNSNFKERVLPLKSKTKTRTNISTQKISKILIPNVGEISFLNDLGRLDYLKDDSQRPTGAILKEITVRNINDQVIKKYTFIYDYKGTGNRLFLEELIEAATQGNDFLPYKFKYDNPDVLPKTSSNNIDYWGFFNNKTNTNLIPDFSDLDYDGGDRTPSEIYAKKGVLTEIIYPTGGKTKYEYESNTYSYIKDKRIDDSNLPVNNTEIRNFNKVFKSSLVDNQGAYIPISFDQIVKMDLLSINNGSSFYNLDKDLFRIRITPVIWEIGGVKLTEPVVDSNRSFHLLNPNETRNFTLQKGHYLFELEAIGIPRDPIPLEYRLTFSYSRKVSTTPNDKYAIGGGIRIKSIKKYDDESETNLLLSRLYSYNLENDASYSSGSLVAQPPKHKYTIDYSFYVDLITNSITRLGQNFTFKYDVITSYNNFYSSESNTIEYKNVTVKEYRNITDQSKTINTYITSIDYPDIGGNNLFFVPINSQNWKRGKLLSSKIYDSAGFKVQQLKNDYIFHTKNSIQLMEINSVQKNCAYERLYSKCESIKGMAPLYDCSNVLDYVANPVYTLSSGVTLIKDNTNTSYFKSPFVVDSIQNKQSYEYNLLKHNYPIRKTIYPNDNYYLGEVYAYPKDILSPSTAATELINQNRISTLISKKKYFETLTKGGHKKLSEQHIIYKDWGNNRILIEKIQVTKGNIELEDRKVYHKYDDKGNPVEVSKKGGTHIVYIWGYNQTQPVAKIENATLTDIPQNYIDNIQNKSNADNDREIDETDNQGNITKYTGNEGQLRIALNALRNVSSLSNSQITTYTYDPLIGVTSITDPREETVYYQYDNFNRLQYVKDKDGNILKENQYNYKN